ncbi:MAG: hypothetical protein M3Y71_13485, partial [Actinomycetota bacterium]|nr:hypothetical protein [Actinomycetota bacterium]
VGEDAEEIEAAQVRSREDAARAAEVAQPESEVVVAEADDRDEPPAADEEPPQGSPAPDRSGFEDTTVIPPVELERLRGVRVDDDDEQAEATSGPGDPPVEEPASESSQEPTDDPERPDPSR